MSPVALKRVYAVCGHARQTEEECPINPEPKTNFLRRLKLKLGKGELPARPETIFMMGFCRACRAYYDFSGRTYFDLKTVILRYWAFKNWQDITQPIPASRVPLDILFGKPCPQVEAQIQACMDYRLEIVTLFNQLASIPERPVEETLMRLENVRSATLEWATRDSAPFRPGQSHILNKTTKSEEDVPVTRGPQVHEDTLSALCGQTHTATLSALCGESDVFVEKLDNETWEKIQDAWYSATKRRSTPVDEKTPEPVSRWSNSTTCVSIHADDENEQSREEEIFLQPVCYKPEVLQPVCYKEHELLRPVCYQPGTPEGNWI